MKKGRHFRRLFSYLQQGEGYGRKKIRPEDLFVQGLVWFGLFKGCRHEARRRPGVYEGQRRHEAGRRIGRVPRQPGTVCFRQSAGGGAAVHILFGRRAGRRLAGPLLLRRLREALSDYGGSVGRLGRQARSAQRRRRIPPGAPRAHAAATRIVSVRTGRAAL